LCSRYAEGVQESGQWLYSGNPLTLERLKKKECSNNNNVKKQEACKNNYPGWNSIHNSPLAEASIKKTIAVNAYM
jgi:hypothetical protein